MTTKRTILVSVSAIAVMASAQFAYADAMDDLVAAAKKEGKLTTIALPHDWCGYGAVIDGFKAKYGLDRQRAQPRRRLGRRDRGDQGQQGQQRPAGARRDRRRPLLRPVGQGRRPAPALQGLDLGHDPGQRQGCRRLLVRRLLRRAGLRGEQGHRQEAARRTGPICSAPTTRTRSRSPAIRAPPTRRSRASTPPASPPPAAMPPRPADAGLKFFAELNKAGNFVPVIGKAGLARPGRDADRHPLGLQRARRPRHAQGQPAGRRRRAEDAASSPASTSRRSAPSRRIRTPPSCGWSTSIPTRVSSRWLKGYCHPIRFNDLAKNGKIPADLLAKLPPAEAYAKAVFPTLDEQGAAKDVDHQAVGRRRRRQRASKLPAARGRAADRRSRGAGCRPRPDWRRRQPADRMVRPTAKRRQPDRRGRTRGSRRCRWAWLGVAPFFIFAAPVPDPADRLSDRRRVPGRRRAFHASTISLDLFAADRSSAPTGSASRSASPRRSSARSSASSSPTPWCSAACRAGCGRPLMTFSGVASNFAGVPLAFAFLATLGRDRPGDRAADQVSRLQHLRDRLQPAELLGPDAHLSLFPDSR